MEYNSAFERTLTTIANEFMANLPSYHEIVSIHHTDADGIASGAIIKAMLTRLNVPFRQMANNLDISWKEYLTRLLSSLKPNTAIIVSDCCPSANELFIVLDKIPKLHFYIIDHHIFQADPNRTLPATVYNCNPTLFGLSGLKEIAGATLNYLFAKAVDSKNQAIAWISGIGMGGDTLDHFENYKSYNKAVIEEAVESGQLEVRTGLCAFGGQFERVDKGLAMSILPFLPSIEGKPTAVNALLTQWGIDPAQKIDSLESKDVQIIAQHLHPTLAGQYVVFPKKKGLFHFAFEHAQLISLLGHQQPGYALDLVGATSPTKEDKNRYLHFINDLILNLVRFIKIPKAETAHALLADVSGQIPVPMWSDISSFSTINQVFDPKKVLFFGGIDNGTMKISVRVTADFIKAHNGLGANVIIKRLIPIVGGQGGGHDLAGGMRISPEQFTTLIKRIDEVIY